MELDEAIKHCEEIAMDKANLACTLWDSKEKARCEDCAKEHRQLAEWLKELKEYKDKNEPKPVIYSGDGYTDGHVVYDWADCPSCSFTIEESDADWEMPYCPSCGQALSWEVKE